MKTLKNLQHLIRIAGSKNGLKYMHILMEKVQEVVCINVSFSVNKRESSQREVLAMVRHKDGGMVNIILYALPKSRRVCRSVLATGFLHF